MGMELRWQDVDVSTTAAPETSGRRVTFLSLAEAALAAEGGTLDVARLHARPTITSPPSEPTSAGSRGATKGIGTGREPKASKGSPVGMQGSRPGELSRRGGSEGNELVCCLGRSQERFVSFRMNQ